MKQWLPDGGRHNPNTRGFAVRLAAVLAAVAFPSVTAQAEVFALDDGSVNTFGGIPGGDLLALNHFDTAGRTVVIDQISVVWHPLSSTVSPAVALYSDPNGDGNPSDAVPLLTYPIYIQPNLVILNNTSFQSYSIPSTVVMGSFFVGAFLSDRESDFDPGIGVDLSHPKPNQSWFIEHSSAGGLDLADPVASGTMIGPVDPYINGNHMIRANYTVLPGPFCVPPRPGLISWWRAEGNVLDAIDGNHGSLVGDATIAPGLVGQTFLFDGDRDGVQVGNVTNLQLQNFTIEAWIKRSDPSIVSFNGNGNGHIFSLGTTGGYGFYLDSQGYLTLASLLINSVVSDARITDTNWHHVAVAKYQTTVVFYVDGVACSAPTYDSGGFVFSAAGYVGAWVFGDIVDNTFYGAIDEVAIYNRPLTTLEIQDIFKADSAGKCVPPPGGPPAITSQPQDQLNRPGDVVTLSVLASGSTPLSYQWFFHSSPLAGQTRAAITLTNVQTDQTGPYFVTVSNTYGSVTSATAQLVVAALPSPACLASPTGAVAWWRAESNAVDTVGINDGLFDQAPRYPSASYFYMAGKVGAAFRFSSTAFYAPRYPTSSNVFVPATPELNLGAGDGLTIETWIKPSAVSGVQPLIEWNDGRGNIGAGIALHDSALESYLTDTNGVAISRAVMRSPNAIVVTSAWQHVVLTFDKTAGLAMTYLNGAIVAKTNLGAFAPQTQAPVHLGYRPSGTYARSYYAGGMDEATLYNRALTPAEIQAIVAAAAAGKCPPPPPPCVPPPPDFVGWWRGESNALDSVDAHHGIITNAVTYVNGVAGRAFRFDTGFVRIPASSNLNVGAGSGFTIETWVSPESSGGSIYVYPKPRQLVGWHNGVVTQGVSLSLAAASTRTYSPLAWEANLVDTQDLSHVIRSPAGLATAGTWQHVALTYEKASGIATLYFNGNPVTQTNLGTFTPKTTANLHFGYQIQGPFRIGGSADAMDELSLYARALSASEIRAIMLSRGVGKCRQPPMIVTQPATLRINEGGDAVFAAVAMGNPILRYQWRWNGTNVPGATGATLIVTNVQLAQSGSYSVRVTNAFGAAVSADAILQVNRPPVADASATIPLVIVPVNCSPTVVLNGSRSSDPDDDLLQYNWLRTGENEAFATGVVALVNLPLGHHSITLVVDDGRATRSHSFAMEVISPAQAIERLMALVNSQAPKPHPLVASLEAARASIERQQVTAASNQLEAFQNKVRAQVGPAGPELAGQLILASQDIISALSQDCASAKPRGKIGKVHRHGNGRVRMEFSAPHGRVYLVEVSTNLVVWEKIGVATECGPDEFEFEDANAARMPTRFYRIVIP